METKTQISPGYSKDELKKTDDDSIDLIITSSIIPIKENLHMAEFIL
ncbi:MAG TPA: hypothetical protein PKA90_01915 [Ignavibacteria bacterium]|nr:hypothetical protein [Ignavibacteria bacterium]HMR39164.1 hypothetical protein [Ignavibacteria bacterium]